MMDREQFIASFIVTWLATRSALEYENRCATGNHQHRAADFAAEDAECLAETAWEACLNTTNPAWWDLEDINGY